MANSEASNLRDFQLADDIHFLADPKYGHSWDKIYERDYLELFALSLRDQLKKRGYPGRLKILSFDRETDLLRSLQTEQDDILIVTSDEKLDAVRVLACRGNVILTPYWDDKICGHLKNVLAYPLGCPKDAWPDTSRVSQAFASDKPTLLIALNWNMRRLRFFFPIFRIPLFQISGVVKWVERRVRRERYNALATKLAEKQLRKNLPNFKLNINFYSHWAAGYPYEQYLQYLRESDYCLCLGGWVSPITYRHFEAIASGSIPITEPIGSHKIYSNKVFLEVAKSKELYRLMNGFNHQREAIIQWKAQVDKFWEECVDPKRFADKLVHK